MLEESIISCILSPTQVIYYILRQLLFPSLCLTLSLPAQAQKNSAHAKEPDVFTAKELFLCACINEGFKKDSLLLSKDTSGQLILERALESGHSYTYMGKVSDLAKRVADSFPVTPFGTRSIFYGCIEYYKSKKLETQLKQFEQNYK